MKLFHALFLTVWATLLSTGSLTATPNTLTPEEKAAGWQLLFDGKSLDGWVANEHPETFTVQDGCIVTGGPRAHLFYNGPVENHDFTNFELRLEVMTSPKANSGVFIHTAPQPIGWPGKGYEVQINNTAEDTGSRTGSLFHLKNTTVSPVPDDVWFTMNIRVEGKRVIISVNDQVISDYTEPPNTVRRGTMVGWLFSHGTFALQAHDPGSHARFRSIAVKVLH